MSIERFFIHTVSVQTYQGRTPTGESYAAPVDVVGFLDDGLVRQSHSNGLGSGGGMSSVELVSKSTFYTHLDRADMFTPGSLVTAYGKTSTVQNIFRRDGGSGPLGRLSHVEVHFE